MQTTGVIGCWLALFPTRWLGLLRLTGEQWLITVSMHHPLYLPHPSIEDGHLDCCHSAQLPSIDLSAAIIYYTTTIYHYQGSIVSVRYLR